MSQIPIPYARHEPYNRDAYVSRMADLMLRRSAEQSAATRRHGDVNAQRWLQAGDVVMSTMSQIGAQRDEERRLALQQEQQRIENTRADRGQDLQERSLTGAEDDRRLDREWRNTQFRETTADRAADRVAVGTRITPDEYKRYDGTSAAESFEHRGAMPERLAATPMIESAGIPSYAGGDPAEQDFEMPTRRTMSRDTAARPEGYERVPTQAERVQLENLRRQDETLQLSRDDRRSDNDRADENARSLGEHRRLLLEVQRDRAATSRASLDMRRRELGMGALSGKQLSAAMSLTNSLKSHPEYTDMGDVFTGFVAVETGVKQDNGFGDIMAINGFQKLVDPGVSVREGDVVLIQSAVALRDKILSSYPIDKLQKGAKLPPEARAALAKAALDLYSTRAKNYNNSAGGQYRRLAEAAGLPFELIGRDFDQNYGSGAPANSWFNNPVRPMKPVTSTPRR